MKILKNSVVSPLSACLLFVLGGGGISLITYVTCATSCTNSTPNPAPSQPIPFTNEYFEWTTSGDELTITGLQSGIDLSNYDTLSIPATCVIGGAEYRVIAIGKQAFRGSFSSYPIDNSNIIRLDLSNASNLDIINDLAFMDCDSLTGSLTIPNSVTSISDDAFNWCSGFNGTLTIGNSVTNIGQFAFATTKFTDVINYSPNFNFADNVGNAKVLIPASSGTSLNYANGTVAGNIASGSLTIPNSVTSIGEYLFYSCSGLTGSLTIPNSVNDIGENAFEECSGFTGSLTIPDSVISIGSSAFYECLGLTGSLTIPDSVTTIGAFAFAYCSGFNTINVSTWTKVPTIGNYAFDVFNAEGGTVLVPANYDDLGITINTFKGLPDTWSLQEV